MNFIVINISILPKTFLIQDVEHYEYNWNNQFYFKPYTNTFHGNLKINNNYTC